VIIACGGQEALMDILPEEQRLRCWRFAPLGALLGRAQLLICHGGQMTIFEALRQKVPVLVIPSHPEQAHNGLCVERINCGARLVPPIAFKGDTQAFADAFLQQPNATIIEKIDQIATNGHLVRGLGRARSQLQRYHATAMIAERLEMN
jgi:hypothetical protein